MNIGMRVYKKNIYESMLAFAFFFFFMSPILSPAVGNNTIYLFWFIPLLDIFFVVKTVRSMFTRVEKDLLLAILIICMVLVLYLKVFTVVKFIFCVISILYLNHIENEGKFKFFYLGININIIIAILQQVLYYINPAWSIALGPTAVSKALWGGHATLTNTNFYPIFDWGMIRTCGWSREAGFFAALLNLCIVYYLFGGDKKTKLQSSLFFGGFVCSFSKMSLLLVPILMVLLMKKYINKIPPIVTITFWVLILVVVAVLLQKRGYYTFENESILHRVIGYNVLVSLPLKQLLLGFGSIADLPTSVYLKVPQLEIIRGRYELCGIPNMIQEIGAVGGAFFMYALRHIKICSTGFLLLFIGTFDVTLFTSTSFVVLAFWLAMNKKVVD